MVNRKIIFYNPYERHKWSGASQRILFLMEGLAELGWHSEWIDRKRSVISKSLIFRYIPFRVRHLIYFFEVYCYLLKGHIVLSEVVLSPVWKNNFYLTVHDLKAFSSVANRGKWKSMFYKISIRLAKNIVCVSYFTKSEVIKNCRVSPERISVVYNGLTKKKISLIRGVTPSDKIFDFVYVSSFAKHKNHLSFIQSLPKGSSTLLIGKDLGTLALVKKEIQSRESVVKVTVLSSVNSDEKLFELIKSARFAVFPSNYEGFGIPVLEYWAAGVPAITSKIAPFEELSMFVDSYFDQTSIKDMSRVLLSYYNGEVWCREVPTNLGSFEQNRVARDLLDVFQLKELDNG